MENSPNQINSPKHEGVSEKTCGLFTKEQITELFLQENP